MGIALAGCNVGKASASVVLPEFVWCAVVFIFWHDVLRSCEKEGWNGRVTFDDCLSAN